MQINACYYIVLLIFLGGCKSQSDNVYLIEKKSNFISSEVRDAAPTDPKPISYVAQKPHDLPLSRYGNRVTYTVDGKDYEVMLTAKGYKSRGIASWYGTKFHKKLTSSGEPYDMYQLTAAHKTLPLPTYVRVKNLENGKVAIVKVNDRGPFHSERILDLSYAAAKELDIFTNGTARVEVEAISNSLHPAQYYLQAGAFSSKEYAYELKNKLESYTHNKVFITHDVGSYLVRVGPFMNKKDAKLFERFLKSKGISGVFAMIM